MKHRLLPVVLRQGAAALYLQLPVVLHQGAAALYLQLLVVLRLVLKALHLQSLVALHLVELAALHLQPLVTLQLHPRVALPLVPEALHRLYLVALYLVALYLVLKALLFPPVALLLVPEVLRLVLKAPILLPPAKQTQFPVPIQPHRVSRLLLHPQEAQQAVEVVCRVQVTVDKVGQKFSPVPALLEHLERLPLVARVLKVARHRSHPVTPSQAAPLLLRAPVV